jgi:hypothetical protein
MTTQKSRGVAKDQASAGHTQLDRFKEAARELGCDEDPRAFEEALRKVGKVGKDKAPSEGTNKGKARKNAEKST